LEGVDARAPQVCALLFGLWNEAMTNTSHPDDKALASDVLPDARSRVPMSSDQLRLLNALARLHMVVPDRERWVTAGVDFRILSYYGMQKLAELPDARGKLAKPLERSRALLGAEGVRYRIAEDAGINPGQWDELLHKLDKIRSVVPLTRKRWNAPTDLRTLVEHIINYWESTTDGERFTQDWHQGKPVTNGTQFVH
jgi:hypothetical protein